MAKKDQDDIEQPPLKYLKSIRNTVDRIAHDMHDFRFRLGKLEETGLHHTRRFHRIEDRLVQIEKRLNLVEA